MAMKNIIALIILVEVATAVIIAMKIVTRLAIDLEIAPVSQ